MDGWIFARTLLIKSKLHKSKYQLHIFFKKKNVYNYNYNCSHAYVTLSSETTNVVFGAQKKVIKGANALQMSGGMSGLVSRWMHLFPDARCKFHSCCFPIELLNRVQLWKTHKTPPFHLGQCSLVNAGRTRKPLLRRAAAAGTCRENLESSARSPRSNGSIRSFYYWHRRCTPSQAVRSLKGHSFLAVWMFPDAWEAFQSPTAAEKEPVLNCSAAVCSRLTADLAAGWGEGVCLQRFSSPENQRKQVRGWRGARQWEPIP